MFDWAASINPKPRRKRWSISGLSTSEEDSDRAKRLDDMKRGIIRMGRM